MEDILIQNFISSKTRFEVKKLFSEAPPLPPILPYPPCIEDKQPNVNSGADFSTQEQGRKLVLRAQRPVRACGRLNTPANLLIRTWKHSEPTVPRGGGPGRILKAEPTWL